MSVICAKIIRKDILIIIAFLWNFFNVVADVFEVSFERLFYRNLSHDLQ